jgi:hypothetical protein
MVTTGMRLILAQKKKNATVRVEGLSMLRRRQKAK